MIEVPSRDPQKWTGSSQARQTRSTVLEILILFGAFSIVVRIQPNELAFLYVQMRLARFRVLA